MRVRYYYHELLELSMNSFYTKALTEWIQASFDAGSMEKLSVIRRSRKEN